MLRREENDRITRTGPGTPLGREDCSGWPAAYGWTTCW